MRHIKITPYGDIGNQLFQYMLALAIKFRTGVPMQITGLNIPSFGIQSQKVRDESFTITVKSHNPPLGALVQLVKNVPNVDIELKCLSTRMVYYSEYLPEFRRYLRFKNTYQTGYDENHLVINVRGAEISKGIHKNYLPIPLKFYHKIIKKTGLKPVFIGQLGDDQYSASLKEQFPDALFRKFTCWEDDFNAIRTSVNIIPAVSTFSWLASWLSETANNIYFPIMGLYHPLARPDIDMLPIDDKRYHFFLSDLLAWKDPADTIEHLINHDFKFDLLTGTALIDSLPLTTGTEGLNIDGIRLSV